MIVRRSPARRRGQPLLALILLMVSWVGARAALWEPPVVTQSEAAKARAAPAVTAPPPAPDRVRRPQAPRLHRPAAPLAPVTAPAIEPGRDPAAVPPSAAPSPALTAPALLAAPPADGGPAGTPGTAAPARLSAADAAAHQELYAAAMAMPTIEESRAMDVPRPQRLPGAAALVQPGGSRWSADAWLVLREGGNGYNAPGAGLPGVVVPVGFYGGSQIGAVLRYRLDTAAAQRPALYLRGASGLHYPRGEEVAVGLALRPVAAVPVAVMAEARATRTPSGTRVRPALAAVTELPPARLPLGLRGEAYVQAGYVGGRDATGFVDGQARAERAFVRTGRFELRAGGGVWGGAQKGARRLDVGPTATLAVPVGPGGARVSADYRFRVAGQAAPSSGAVLTLSAGF